MKYGCELSKQTMYTIIFSLAPRLKLCNFVAVRVEKNLVETIFTENST